MFSHTSLWTRQNCNSHFPKPFTRSLSKHLLGVKSHSSLKNDPKISDPVSQKSRDPYLTFIHTPNNGVSFSLLCILPPSHPRLLLSASPCQNPQTRRWVSFLRSRPWRRCFSLSSDFLTFSLLFFARSESSERDKGVPWVASGVRVGRRRSLWRRRSPALVRRHLFHSGRLPSRHRIVITLPGNLDWFRVFRFLEFRLEFFWPNLEIELLIGFGIYCFVCREVYAVSIVGPFPTAVTNLLDLSRL